MPEMHGHNVQQEMQSRIKEAAILLGLSQQLKPLVSELVFQEGMKISTFLPNIWYPVSDLDGSRDVKEDNHGEHIYN